MRKKLLIILSVSILSAFICFGCWFALHFHVLFEQSTRLFAIRHQFFPELVFHTDKWTYEKGERISIYASMAYDDSVSLCLSSLPSQQTILQQKIRVQFQPLADHASIKGTAWKASHVLRLAEEIDSGWYLISLEKGSEVYRQSIFIKRVDTKKRIAHFFSTNTWNAYNHWGGQSIYSKERTETVSFFRPQPLSDPYLENTYPNYQYYFQAANKDLYLETLLDTSGYEVDAYSMEDLEESSRLATDYDLWIFSTHTEYWTEGMFQALAHHLEGGGSVINLAGNVAAYKSELDLTHRSLTVKRQIDQLWEEQDSLVQRPFGLTAGFLGFHTYAPYQITTDSSWILKKTSLEKGSLVGKTSDSYDYTLMYGSLWERLWGIRKKGKMAAACGLEIDKIYHGTPENWIPIAKGLNAQIDGKGEVYPEKEEEINWSGGDCGQWGYYQHKGGGYVFSVGSMAFTGALPYDPELRQMVVNMVEASLDVSQATP
ncbi:MAG: N,N-dimethylformamidase beta subunit family domain-containing protein [Bacteroidota bacterium]